ncbi:MAG TPA: hypothetical protein VMA54_08470 [Steroidobacteraceae bacterium]|nr:hypothetical protein [Steroidobacteraceae bacterium]
MRNPLALFSSQVELRDRAGGHLREESFERFQRVESSQYTNERDQFHTEAGLYSLDGAFADAGSLRELRLGQACFDAVSLDPLTEDVGYGGISQIGCNAHKSPLIANSLWNRLQFATRDELYELL